MLFRSRLDMTTNSSSTRFSSRFNWSFIELPPLGRNSLSQCLTSQRKPMKYADMTVDRAAATPAHSTGFNSFSRRFQTDYRPDLMRV